MIVKCRATQLLKDTSERVLQTGPFLIYGSALDIRSYQTADVDDDDEFRSFSSILARQWFLRMFKAIEPNISGYTLVMAVVGRDTESVLAGIRSRVIVDCS